MDVHRCRFVPYQPSAINAVAFSHPRTRSAKQVSVARLAVGRANGDIEIWNPSSGTWHQELVIRGGKDRSIDGLVWVNEPDQDLGDGRFVVGKLRLFSIGYTSTVTEWDLEKGKPKRHASGQHGDIWCLAAQPPAQDGTMESQYSNKLIAGTIDGELVMYSIEDDDLRFQRVVVRSPTKKAQMVSVTFQSRKVAIVGCSDSTIRAYDITKGHMLRRMTLGSDLVGGSKDIIVWSVKCLPGGNIVSADSTGQVCIWDGKTYTQSQRLQSHKQDVLSLSISADGSAIMSGGMDRRTVLYKQNAGAGNRWSKVWGRRYHDHDVKAMASFEHGRISVVVTGGPDSNLMVVPLKEMGRENHRTVSNLPQQPPISSASKARFIVSWWEREVHIWVLRKAANDILNSAGDDVDINQNRKLLKTIVVKGDSNIASATINQEGTLLIVSTSTDIKAFRLDHQDPVKPSDVKLSSIDLPQKLRGAGATQVQLSPDGKWVCVVQDGSRVVMAGIEATEGADNSTVLTIHSQRLSRLRRHIPRYILNGGLGSYDRNVTHVSFSADSKMVAVADLAGYVDTWILRGTGENLQNGTEVEGEDDDASSGSDSDEEEAEGPDSTKEQWARNPSAKLLPKLPSSPVVLSFSEDVPDANSVKDYTLAAITASWNVLAFHPLQGSLTPWSRRHPRKTLPAPVQDLLDLAKGAVWQGSRLWVYGVSFLLMLDMAQDLPKPTANSDALISLEQSGLKRKRIGTTSGAGGKMTRDNLAPHRIGKYVNGQWEDIEVDGASPQGEEEGDSDDEMADAPDGELSQLRNANGNANKQQDDEYVTERKSWWITYKYRPVLGVVPLNTLDQPLEVALVERPTWDVEKPERYYVGEEWER
ncbi:U3 small nucleolar RNA-associated protein 4 [Cladobotryum mycophilum]|uniref:U3 small nucleolar RNA-associated protein 4 n=1 Tax=Cladobotryum mycophilum TaxID=491253 RepID=A0ABR0SK75_9HYPO